MSTRQLEQHGVFSIDLSYVSHIYFESTLNHYPELMRMMRDSRVVTVFGPVRSFFVFCFLFFVFLLP